MRILVTGPESSGGRLAAQLLAADPGLDVAHFSAPHGPAGGDRHWPDTRDYAGFAPERAVVTVRDRLPMVCSQLIHHLPGATAAVADANVDEAYRRTFRWLRARAVPLWLLDYEQLVAHPHDELAQLWRWLGRPMPDLAGQITIYDGDAKWIDRN